MCVLLIYIYTWYMRSVWPSTHFWFRSPQPGSTHRALRTLRPLAGSVQRCGMTTIRRPWRTGCATFGTCTDAPNGNGRMGKCGKMGKNVAPNMVDLFSEFFNHFQFWYNLIAQIVNFELSKFCVFCTFARHDSGEVILLMFPSRPGYRMHREELSAIQVPKRLWKEFECHTEKYHFTVHPFVKIIQNLVTSSPYPFLIPNSRLNSGLI